MFVFHTSIISHVKRHDDKAGGVVRSPALTSASRGEGPVVIARRGDISDAKRTKERKTEETNETEGERTQGGKEEIGTIRKKGVDMKASKGEGDGREKGGKRKGSHREERMKERIDLERERGEERVFMVNL